MTAQTIDVARVRAALDRRESEEKERLRARFRAAWLDFESIVARLSAEPAVARIYQWGSLLEETHFSDRSDIDIAIEGEWDAAAFFRMFGEAQALTPFALDLVELHKIDPLHAASIRRKGRLVYERGPQVA